MKNIGVFVDAVDAAKAAAVASGAGAIFTWDMSASIIGVPLSVLFAALLGSALGIAYGEPIQQRSRQIIIALVNTFVSAAFTAIISSIPFMSWVGHAPIAAVAIIVGFAARWAIPACVERIPAMIRGLTSKAEQDK